MIVDRVRELPTQWTADECVDLFDHARFLGQNGNPAGYGLTIDLFPFVGVEDERGRGILPRSSWDVDGMVAWIAENTEKVQHVWNLDARPDWW